MKQKNSEKVGKKVQDFFGRVWGYVVWVLILILAVTLVRNIQKVASIKSEVAAEQARINKIKEDNAKLESEITQAQSATFIEKQIRDKLGLARAGEAIVVLPDDDTLRKLAPQTQEESDTLPDPNWKKWLKLFL